MKVAYICGYWSDLAGKRPRKPPFYEAFLFCWAVRSGQYRYDFVIEKTGGPLKITRNNFSRVRPTFGQWAAQRVKGFTEKDVLLIPVPNKAALPDVTTYRTLDMVRDCFKGTDYKASVFDGLRWDQALTPAHEGGPRSRAELLPHLVLRQGAVVNGKDVILIDDVVTTGASLLACQDRLIAESANVIGAITCGRTVYDKKEPPFKARTMELTGELHDIRGSPVASKVSG
jgi:predicted amidophosphoribosyltransferase